MDRAQLTSVFNDTIAALNPADLVAADLRGRALDPGDAPVTVLALGKAAAGMVAGAARVFGDDMSGLAVTAHPVDLPATVRGIVGSHPVPDNSSVAAGDALLAAAAAAPPTGLVICLVSGGGSALAEVPVPGVSIGELAALTDRLLRSGAAIDEINVVRRALSRIKGGGLAAAIRSPRLLTLAISDVGAAPPETIASGPTLPAPVEPGRARHILEQYGLLEMLPPAARDALDRLPPRVERPQDFTIVADGAMAARLAAAAATTIGKQARVVDVPLAGEARDAAARVIAAGTYGADVAIYWGETTVTVTGTGRGGRNHEAALAAALTIGDRPGAFLAGGTDGIDGSTAAAGAVVDATTVRAARSAGLDPRRYLDANNSGDFFAAVPGQIVTGPTGTNVADLWLCSVAADLESAR
jgi:hydroxypyruvate reductase